MKYYLLPLVHFHITLKPTSLLMVPHFSNLNLDLMPWLPTKVIARKLSLRMVLHFVLLSLKITFKNETSSFITVLKFGLKVTLLLNKTIVAANTEEKN